MNLEMRRRCEKCTAALQSEGEAYICSFECTFCAACTANLNNVCPNCGGELVARPRRTTSVPPASGVPPQNIAWKSGLRSGVVWISSFGIWAFISLAASATIYEMYQLMNGSAHLRAILGMQFSTIFTYAPITPFAFAFALQYPIQRHNWWKRCLLHLAAALAFTGAHIILKAATPYGYWDPQLRAWSSALGNSHPHTFRAAWGVLKSMFLGSVVDDISGAYLPTVLIAHLVSYYRRMQEREVRATQLEAQLTKAHLQTLKSQLQPHFLFNTLHSISALMLTDVIAADRMMTSLSDLLRLSLEDSGAQTTTLGREIEFLDVYLNIEKTRFEDRLHIVFDIAPECLDAQVPHLLLQPLVENAVRHGISKRSAPGEIRVAASREGRNLQICIRDNGPGFALSYDSGSKHGLGLSLTRERLLVLYGSAQSCVTCNVPQGGAEVCLRIPFFIVEPAVKPEMAVHA